MVAFGINWCADHEKTRFRANPTKHWPIMWYVLTHAVPDYGLCRLEDDTPGSKPFFSWSALTFSWIPDSVNVMLIRANKSMLLFPNFTNKSMLLFEKKSHFKFDRLKAMFFVLDIMENPENHIFWLSWILSVFGSWCAQIWSEFIENAFLEASRLRKRIFEIRKTLTCSERDSISLGAHFIYRFPCFDT